MPLLQKPSAPALTKARQYATQMAARFLARKREIGGAGLFGKPPLKGKQVQILYSPAAVNA